MTKPAKEDVEKAKRLEKAFPREDEPGPRQGRRRQPARRKRQRKGAG